MRIIGYVLAIGMFAWAVIVVLRLALKPEPAASILPAALRNNGPKVKYQEPPEQL